MTAVRIEALCKTYGAVKALDGLSLEVPEGSVFGFLGPNGAGKTTTIRILTGLAHPTSGRAWVAGVETGHDGALARKIGHLPEEPAFYTWMTPRELLEYVGNLFGLSGKENKARSKELLELAGLWDVRKRRIGGFSRGMRQRLGIAQALVNRPEVIFLDEPVSALDPAGRRDVLELIQGLAGTCTVFMSTHILADVERVCDVVGIINKGKMVQVSRQDELMERYVLPVFEVQTLPGCEAKLQTWVQALATIAWVESTEIEGHTVRVRVRDLETARTGLLQLLAADGLPVDRFEAARPSLEEIFLRLVGEEQHA